MAGNYDFPAAEMGQILLEALGELRSLRKNLNTPGDDTTKAKQVLESVIQKTEAGLRLKAEELSEVLMYGGDGGVKELEQLLAYQDMPHAGAPEVHGQRAVHLRKAQAHNPSVLAKPASDMTRAYLHHKYGLPMPSAGLPRDKPPPRAAGGNRGGRIRSSLIAKPGQILPRHLREDPQSAAPRVIEEGEIEKGLFSLVNRGLIAKDADLTATLVAGGAPMRYGASVMHDAVEDRRTGGSIATQDQVNYNMSHLKLDLLTPVKPSRSGTGARKQARVSKVQLGMPGSGAASPPPSGAELAAAAEEGGGDPRGYEQMLDSFSLHEILIRRGLTLDSTPEFLSFQRAHATHWTAVVDLILQLESICSEYAVPLAVVDGKALADLAVQCQARNEPCQVDDLLSTVQNIQQVSKLLTEGKRRQAGGEEHAATVVQAHFRGMRTRKDVPPSTHIAKAIAIQRAWRCFQALRKTRARIHAALQARREAFGRLQETFVGQWERIQEGNKVVVHLPSFSGSDEQRLSTSKLAVRQNSQLSRLCDLADPSVDVVYVSPLPVNEDVEGYFSKLLQVGGVEDPPAHYKIITPENIARLPPHASLAHQLLFSPLALKRVRAFIKGRPGYIVPGYVGEPERQLAVLLGLPLLAPSPDVAIPLRNKSAIRDVFRRAEVNIPPGLELPAPPQPHQGYRMKTKAELGLLAAIGNVPGAEGAATGGGGAGGKGEGLPSRAAGTRGKPASGGGSPSKGGGGGEGAGGGGEGGEEVGGEGAPPPRSMPKHSGEADLPEVLARLVVAHPRVPRWLIKIDDETGGRGLAHLDVSVLKPVQQVLEAVMPMSEGMREALEDEELILVLTSAIKKALPRRAGVADPSLFPTWAAFEAAFKRRGGVVEACPAMVTGSPSVNLFIDPLGEVTVLATHEQVFCPAYRFIGASFPQSSVPHAALAAAAMAVGEACYSEGVIGHVGVDFVALKEANVLRLWAVDLNVRPTATQATFDLFHFVAGGDFDAEAGAYTVEIPAEEEGSEAMLARRAAGEAEAEASQEGEQQRRFYVMNDFVSHPDLCSIQYSAFFNRCRLDGVCYDMEARVGTAFNLLDTFASGVVGVICVGRTPYEAFAELAQALDFVARQVGADTLPAGSEGEWTLRNVHSTMKYLADKLLA